MSFSSEVKEELLSKSRKLRDRGTGPLSHKQLDYKTTATRDPSPCRAYIREAFLKSGTISDPNKSYRFEIITKSEDEAAHLQELIREFDIKAGITTRKSNYVVYCTDGEDIADILSVMEAHKSRMNYENVKIVKGVRENINRKVNCETANITKTITASVKQIEDIEYIRDTVGLDSLSETLQEMAEVRLEFPDVTLQELGSHLATPIGKSGVNHRLRRISKIADELRDRGTGSLSREVH